MKLSEYTDSQAVTDELRAKRKQSMRTRFKHATGQLQNPMELRALRKDIARLATRASQLRQTEGAK